MDQAIHFEALTGLGLCSIFVRLVCVLKTLLRFDSILIIPLNVHFKVSFRLYWTSDLPWH